MVVNTTTVCFYIDVSIPSTLPVTPVVPNSCLYPQITE